MNPCCPKYIHVPDGDFRYDRYIYKPVPGSFEKTKKPNAKVYFSKKTNIISYSDDEEPIKVSAAAREKLRSRRATGPKNGDPSILPSAQ
jgi:hypothetical protein